MMKNPFKVNSNALDVLKCGPLRITQIHSERDAIGWTEAEARYAAHAIHQHDKFVKALRGMMGTHGMHGPCRNHNCKSCTLAYNTANDLLKAEEELK
jgi:hypothetical protein